MSEVDLVGYLDKNELNFIKNLLDNEGIVFIVKEHGERRGIKVFTIRLSFRGWIMREV